MVSDMHGLGVEVPSRKNLVVRRLRNVTRVRAGVGDGRIIFSGM